MISKHPVQKTLFAEAVYCLQLANNVMPKVNIDGKIRHSVLHHRINFLISEIEHQMDDDFKREVAKHGY